MKKMVLTVSFFALASFLFVEPGFVAAQNHGAPQEKQKTRSSKAHGKMSMMQGNMGMLADITAKMHEILSKGRISPEEQNRILHMMERMSRVMKEMSVPHDEPVKKWHQRELHEMNRNLDTIYKNIFH